MAKKIILILVILGIFVFAIGGGIYATSRMQKETYQVNLRLESTSGYPPHLIQIRNQGVEKETVLTSILPSFSVRPLSIAEQHTRMDGNITIDCGGEYLIIEEFNLATSNPGDQMRQEFTFKKIPPDRICLVTAKTFECETVQPKCTKNTVTLTFRTSE